MNKSCPRPDAIILNCWLVADPDLRQLDIEPALVTMGDKPMLQRVLEQLLELGCREIAVFHGDQPQAAEALLGDGERWGCRISHHYARSGNRPLQALARLAPLDGQLCWLARADTVINPAQSSDTPFTAYFSSRGEVRWTGWARLDAASLVELAKRTTNARDLELCLVAGLCIDLRLVGPSVSTASVEQALASIGHLLSSAPGPDGIAKSPRSVATWIGNGSRVTPTAELLQPVYIGHNVLVGEHVKIGPNVIIGDGCIIDSNSHLRESLILANTYIGKGLEVVSSIVSGSRLANAGLGAALEIADRQLLANIGSEVSGRNDTSLTERLLALLLWLATWPLLLVGRFSGLAATPRPRLRIGIPGPALGTYREIEVRAMATQDDILKSLPFAWCGHFLHTFHPGLLDVVAGRLKIIGPQPRTVKEISALPDYWQRLYRAAPAGLLNETLLLDHEGADPELRYAGDAMSAVRQPFLKVTSLLIRYVAKVSRDAFSTSAISQPLGPLS